MKSSKGLFLILALFLSCSLFAQRGNVAASVDVVGTVIEEGTNIPVEQATIRLLSVKDSVLIGGAASSNKGTFTIKNVKAGSYLLHVSFVGFDPLYQPLQITGKANPVNTGKLTLHDGSIELGEAVVIGKAAEVVVRNDTVEYNADSYKVAEGSVLEDLLKKMPGVEIDKDGKITINGKEIKKIMVDGKEFFSDDPKVASKNLPTKMVDKVQVLDKKSDMTIMTGFDDGNEETIINLTVKPGMKQGWFGNAYGGYGSKERYEGNAMINRFMNNDQFTFTGGLNNTNNMGFTDLASNMFQGMGGGRRFFGGSGNGITQSGNAGLNISKEFSQKMTLGGNIRYSGSDNFADLKNNQVTALPGDSLERKNTVSSNDSKSNSFAANLRMEWKPDTLTSIIFRPDFSYSKNESWQNERSATVGGLALEERLDSLNTVLRNSTSDKDGFDLNAQLEFSRKLNNKGRVFSASLSGGYSNSESNEMNYSDTKFFKNPSKNNIIDQQANYENTGYNYRAYTSWVEPIGHNNFIQLTYSFSQRNQESLKSSYNIDNDGNYTQLDTAYSKSYRNNFINQRASLSFKAQRAKYNYTLGMNADPSHTSSEMFVGDSILSKLSRNVVNISPMAQFNYMFDKRTNFRIDYNGRTSQPTMAQLQPVDDISDPINIIRGNPDLNPRYTNNLSLRFQKFIPEQQTAFMFMANGNYIVNDIISVTNSDSLGQRLTTYANINGNYSGNARFIVNTPLKNKKFTINSMTMSSFNSQKSITNNSGNTTKNFVLMERVGIDFRSSIVDFGINGNIRYNDIKNSYDERVNQTTYNYGLGATTGLYLPFDFKIESDITHSWNSGYADGYSQKETLWNASASKTFLKKKEATIRLKIYDILQQRSNISRSVDGNRTTDTEYNTLTSYFIVHFVYRFSIFKGGATDSDSNANRPRRGPGGGGGDRVPMNF